MHALWYLVPLADSVSDHHHHRTCKIKNTNASSERLAAAKRARWPLPLCALPPMLLHPLFFCAAAERLAAAKRQSAFSSVRLAAAKRKNALSSVRPAAAKRARWPLPLCALPPPSCFCLYSPLSILRDIHRRTMWSS